MSILIKTFLIFTCVFRIHCIEEEHYGPLGPVVELPNGKVRGYNHRNYVSFQSIPYAEPPIGENRFEAPKPYAGKWESVRDATKRSNACLQWDQFRFNTDKLFGVEDCLTIDIFTPSVTNNKTYPVVIFIHGGSFMFGAANQNGHQYLMKDPNIVLVKMNYRVGPLGFLSTEDDVIPGNFGLKDQLLALQWTKANIGIFNGDPEKMSVIGFSAGAASVHLQMMNKSFENIAKSAISFSGTAFGPWVITRSAAKRATTLAAHLGCSTQSSAAIKSCLKEKDPVDIVRAVDKFHNIKYNPFTVFGPVIESSTVSNAFLTEEPEDIVKNGKSAQIPWLASYTKEDGGYNAAELLEKVNNVELLEQLNQRWNELAPANLFLSNLVEEDKLDAFTMELKQKYLGDKKFSLENYLLVQKMYTDVLFADGVKKAWKLHKEYSSAPVYGYIYDNEPPIGIAHFLCHRDDVKFGTVHGDDFYLLFKSPLPIRGFTENQKIMSANFVEMVKEFCTTGKLHFGTCEFVENNSKSKGLFVMEIKKDSCDTVDFEV